MRRITRWLNQHKNNEDGLIAITVTILAAVMFVMAAFSVDIGSAVAITRSAQNSADAAALAVATDCSRTGAPSSVTPYLTTGQVPVAMTPACNSGGTGAVKVTVSRTKDWTFGKLVGLGSYTKTRSATAKWGALGEATGTFPITVAICGVQGAVQGAIITLYSDDVIGCGNGPGQFGLVGNGCSNQGITLDANMNLTVAQGNSLQQKTGCDAATFNSQFLNKTVLVPIWDSHVGTQYHVVTFAQLTLTAWSANGNADSGVPFVFDGVHALPPANKNPKNCPVQNGHDDNSGACIQGVLHGFTTQTGTLNPGIQCFSNNIACFVYLDH
jgi:Flp pilus assembly protein TadG